MRDVQQIIQQMRENSEEEFGRLFSDATKLADEVDGVIRKPRTASRQTARENHPYQSGE